MMKIFHICAVAVVCVFLAGCTDDSYRGMYDFYNAGYRSSNIPVWIKIGESSDILAKSGTKGTGTVEDANGLTGKDFYIYAFSKDQDATYRLNARTDELNTLLDGSIDGDGAYAGRKAAWNRIYQRVVWEDGKDVYWPVSNSRDYRYDFFAYYIDDMAVTNLDYNRGDDEVYINVEIDGKQDIMTSKAAPSDETLDAMFPDEMDRAMYKHYYCYSHNAAVKNIQPEFVFNHHLAKIRFRIVPGVTDGSVNRVTIHGIKVESKYKGSLRVASKSRQQGLKFEKDMKDFDLKEADGSDLDQDKDSSNGAQGYVIDTAPTAGGEHPGVDVGDYLLLAPSTNGYWVHLEMSEIRDFGGEHEDHLSKVTYSAFIYRGAKSAPDPFEAGDEYTVTLHVYGRADVRVNIEMEPWKPGGYIIPDLEDVPPIIDGN